MINLTFTFIKSFCLQKHEDLCHTFKVLKIDGFIPSNFNPQNDSRIKNLFFELWRELAGNGLENIQKNIKHETCTYYITEYPNSITHYIIIIVIWAEQDLNDDQKQFLNNHREIQSKVFKGFLKIVLNNGGERKIFSSAFCYIKKTPPCFHQVNQYTTINSLLLLFSMLDTTIITIKSGKGGDGCVAARREAGVPFGGPAGGDGGKGGNVIFRASKDEQTLARFRHHNRIEAQDGQDGMIKDRYGANAEDKIVIVPIGTIVKHMESGHILFQFTTDGQEYIVAKGGKGGAGNIHFKNAVNQYPTFALRGEPGQEFVIGLELQMLGDVGLIGTPSVGKSSIINTSCATKAKTAEYHFTTLEPNIGICDLAETTFSFVDIPGVVEGASAGKGLGNEFLRHILKARIFALVVDMDSYEASFEKLTTVFDEIILYIHQRFVGSTEFGEPIETVTLELKQEDGYIILECIVTLGGKTELLFQKAIHIVANKYDMVNDPDIANEFIIALTNHIQSHFQTKRGWSVSAKDLLKNTFVVSAATHEGIEVWTNALAHMIKNREIKHIFLFDTVATETITHERIKDVTDQELNKLIEYGYLDNSSSRAKVWEIWDHEICRLTNILPRGNEQAEYRYRNVMMKKKYLADFEKVGMMHGDIMKIKSYYTGHDDRYIMYV